MDHYQQLEMHYFSHARALSARVYFVLQLGLRCSDRSRALCMLLCNTNTVRVEERPIYHIRRKWKLMNVGNMHGFLQFTAGKRCV